VPLLLLPQVERLLPLCEHVLVVKRFVETRSRIDYPLVTQVRWLGSSACAAAAAAAFL
jgi:hypothetical protein